MLPIPIKNVSPPTRVEQAWDQFSPSSNSSTSSSFQVTNDSAVGSLFLEVTQGSYSYTQVEDIEPLEIGALFGNVGGFWGKSVGSDDVSAMHHFGWPTREN